MELALDGLEGIQSIDDLLRLASTKLGVPVSVSRNEPGLGALTGVAIEHTGGVLILVRPEDSRFYQDHVICHEVAHVLAGTPCEMNREALSVAAQGIDPKFISSIYTRQATELLPDRDAHDTVSDHIAMEREIEAAAAVLGKQIMRNRLPDRWVLG